MDRDNFFKFLRKGGRTEERINALLMCSQKD